MARSYATAEDYQDYTGQTPPADIDILLKRASVMLDAQVLRVCRYDVDTAGLPTNPLVAAAFRDAACAQVAWWEEIGDSTGAAGAGWGSVEIGTAKIARSLTATGPESSPARQVAPAAGDALTSPDLTPDIFVLGAVCTP